MTKPRVLVLRAPGTNCDQETEYAFEQAGGLPDLVHVNRWSERPDFADQYQIMCIPGGFSFGDDIAAGQILANLIRRRLKEAFMKFREDGKLILGICNGFQVLLKSGILLSDPNGQAAPASLAWNASGRFEDRWVHLATHGDRSVFLQGVQSMYLPIAHAEGRFVVRRNEIATNLANDGLLALRYASTNGLDNEAKLPFPWNPNGSELNVAGVCDISGRILGLMPHPERYIDRTQHPRWTREELPEQGDGLLLFQNAVRFFD